MHIYIYIYTCIYIYVYICTVCIYMYIYTCMHKWTIMKKMHTLGSGRVWPSVASGLYGHRGAAAEASCDTLFVFKGWVAEKWEVKQCRKRTGVRSVSENGAIWFGKMMVLIRFSIRFSSEINKRHIKIWSTRGVLFLVGKSQVLLDSLRQ